MISPPTPLILLPTRSLVLSPPWGGAANRTGVYKTFQMTLNACPPPGARPYFGVGLCAEAGAGGRAGHAQARVQGPGRVLTGVRPPCGAQSHRAARLPQGRPPGFGGLGGLGLGLAWFLRDTAPQM